MSAIYLIMAEDYGLTVPVCYCDDYETAVRTSLKFMSRPPSFGMVDASIAEQCSYFSVWEVTTGSAKHLGYWRREGEKIRWLVASDDNEVIRT